MTEVHSAGWTKENIGTFLGTLDDVPERYYNFADIDNDGSDEMLVADNYLWAVKPLSDTEFDKQLVSIDPLGGYASVAYGRPSTDADIYKSEDYSSWYAPGLDIYLMDGRFYISGVHISAAAPYHIGWISEVKYDNERSGYYLEPIYTWGYAADTALSYDGHIDSEHSADAEKFFADAVIVSGKKAGEFSDGLEKERSDVYIYDGKTYTVDVTPITGSAVLFGIWHTDGDNFQHIGDFSSSGYKWMYPIKNGKPVIVTYTFSVRGFNYADAPVIAADVYKIENNMLEKCGTEAGKQFFWLYNEDEDKSRLFIFDEIKDGSCFAPDDIQNLALSGDIKQELAWDNGRLKVVSGYGKYVTDECSNNEKEIMEIFEKAYDLYLAADGISSEEYINIDGVFYLDGNEEDKTLDERIGEYSSSFTRRECERIFNGMREKDGTEYYVYSYGEKNGEAKDVLTSEKILENDLTDYDKVTLFSPVRGIDYSYAAGYAEIVEKSADSIEMKYTALYKGSDSTEENVVFADGKWSLEDGSDYILSDNDTVRSYEYHLLNEDGHWKFDDFVCYN